MSEGYMQLSNAVIDDLMSMVSGNAFKVYMAIYRKTKGFNKTSDSIPMSQLHELTGIKDKHTLIAAIDDLEVNNFIKVDRKLGRTNLFQITSQWGKSTPVLEVNTSGENPHGVVGKIHTRTSGENPHPSKDNTKDNIQKTIIVTPKPKKPVQKTNLEKLIERGCSEQLAKDFIEHRKTKKSAITDTALKLISTQAAKAEIEFFKAVEICIARNWISFNASWKWQDDQPIATHKPQQRSSLKDNSFLESIINGGSQTRDITPKKQMTNYEVGHA